MSALYEAREAILQVKRTELFPSSPAGTVELFATKWEPSNSLGSLRCWPKSSIPFQVGYPGIQLVDWERRGKNMKKQVTLGMDRQPKSSTCSLGFIGILLSVLGWS